MIGVPFNHNDLACLCSITEVVAELVQRRDPLLVDLAAQHATTEGLAAWIRSLPQRNDEDLPDDGPKVDRATAPIAASAVALRSWEQAMRLGISFVGWPPLQPIATAGAHMFRSRGTLYRARARGELPIAGRRGRALDFPSRGPRSPGGVGSLGRARRRGVRVSDSMSPKTQPAPQPQPAPPAPQPAPVLTAKDLSRELGVSVETLRGWRYRGVGPAWFACGQSPRYLHTAVDAWAAAGGSKRESRRGKRGVKTAPRDRS